MLLCLLDFYPGHTLHPFASTIVPFPMSILQSVAYAHTRFSNAQKNIGLHIHFSRYRKIFKDHPF